MRWAVRRELGEIDGDGGDGAADSVARVARDTVPAPGYEEKGALCASKRDTRATVARRQPFLSGEDFYFRKGMGAEGCPHCPSHSALPALLTGKTDLPL